MMELFVTVIVAVISSSGLWAFLSKLHDKNDSKTQLLIGLAHDRIMHLCEKYIERGGITKEEYDDLHQYLYDPYKENGGNGSAERMMAEVDKLSIISASDIPNIPSNIEAYIKAVHDHEMGDKGMY